MPANAGRGIEENLLRIAQDAHAASAALQRFAIIAEVVLPSAIAVNISSAIAAFIASVSS